MGRTIGFYQKFSLDLQRLSSALRCVLRQPQLGRAELAECMGVNHPVGEGYLGWLRHCGLMVSQSSGERRQARTYAVSPFGQLVAQHDPALRNIGTLWLLHYYLATAHAERSDAWHVLVNEFLAPGKGFTGTQYTAYFVEVMGLSATNKSSLEHDPREALNTYVRPQGLSRLGILVKDGETYRVNQPTLPPPHILAYILFDWWDRHYTQTTVLRRSQLAQEPDSVGRVCVSAAQGLERIVRELSGHDYIHFSATEHEPVSRLYTDPPHRLLEEYYTQL